MGHLTPHLQAGDRVGVVAASSAFKDPEPLEQGLSLLRSWGLKAEAESIPQRRWGYLAGSDQDQQHKGCRRWP